MKEKIFNVVKNHTENEETAMQLTNELCILLNVSGSLFPEKDEIQAAYRKASEDDIKHNLSYDDENWFEAGVHFCSNYNIAKSNDR